MKTRLLSGVVATACLLSAHAAWAVSPTEAELAKAMSWAAVAFRNAPGGGGVGSLASFTYDGKPSAELLPTWKRARSVRRLDGTRTQYTLTYTDAKTGLVVRCVGIQYSDFPVFEWTLYFKNTGKADTPIIADVQAIDMSLSRSGKEEFTLHHTKGDTCAIDSFQPLVETLAPKGVKQIAPGGGRPTSGSNPFWNIAFDGGGMMLAVGWPGQWAARFERDDGQGLRIRAGQELTHFRLRPGEEVRSPLVVLLFYQGDWLRGQNLWRRWMVAHNIPRPGGKLVPTHYGACWSDPLHPVGEIEMAMVKGYVREKIPLDFYFIDAGWYPSKRDWWTDAGTWEVDKERFPKGIREISDYAHANGMQFVLWFEPERAGPGTWLSENHPEWILGGKSGGLVNMGNPAAWQWIVNRIDSLIKSEGVDVYRQDFNVSPLGYWRGADAKDRQGITENKHAAGYLAYWDELMRRNPKLWIDSCASGGQRNDLETLRRGVPLLRSDCFWDASKTATIQQCQTYGLSLWVPYYGSGTLVPTKYWFRSTIFPAARVGWDTRKTDLDYKLLRDMIAEFHKVQPYLLGDYYPLTPYSMEKTACIAWQFDEPEAGGGFVQAFRREEAKQDSLTLKLQGLDLNATYAVENLDGGKVEKMTGKELSETGLQAKFSEKPEAALFVYKKVQ